MAGMQLRRCWRHHVRAHGAPAQPPSAAAALLLGAVALAAALPRAAAQGGCGVPREVEERVCPPGSQRSVTAEDVCYGAIELPGAAGAGWDDARDACAAAHPGGTLAASGFAGGLADLEAACHEGVPAGADFWVGLRAGFGRGGTFDAWNATCSPDAASPQRCWAWNNANLDRAYALRVAAAVAPGGRVFLADAECDCAWDAYHPLNQDTPSGRTDCVLLADGASAAAGAAPINVGRYMRTLGCGAPLRYACCQWPLGRTGRNVTVVNTKPRLRSRGWPDDPAYDVTVPLDSPGLLPVFRVPVDDDDPPATLDGRAGVAVVDEPLPSGYRSDDWVVTNPGMSASRPLHSVLRWQPDKLPPLPPGAEAVSIVVTVRAVDMGDCASDETAALRVTFVRGYAAARAPCPLPWRGASADRCFARTPADGALAPMPPLQRAGAEEVAAQAHAACKPLHPRARLLAAPPVAPHVFNPAGNGSLPPRDAPIDVAAYTAAYRGCFEGYPLAPALWTAGRMAPAFLQWQCPWQWLRPDGAMVPAPALCLPRLRDPANYAHPPDAALQCIGAVRGPVGAGGASGDQSPSSPDAGADGVLFLPLPCSSPLPACCELPRPVTAWAPNRPPRFGALREVRVLAAGTGYHVRPPRLPVAEDDAGGGSGGGGGTVHVVEALDPDRRTPGDVLPPPGVPSPLPVYEPAAAVTYTLVAASATAYAVGDDGALEPVVDPLPVDGTGRVRLAPSSPRDYHTTAHVTVEPRSLLALLRYAARGRTHGPTGAAAWHSEWVAVTLRACDRLGACTGPTGGRTGAAFDGELAVVSLACDPSCPAGSVEAVPCVINPFPGTILLNGSADPDAAAEAYAAATAHVTDRSRPRTNRLCVDGSRVNLGAGAAALAASLPAGLVYAPVLWTTALLAVVTVATLTAPLLACCWAAGAPPQRGGSGAHSRRRGGGAGKHAASDGGGSSATAATSEATDVVITSVETVAALSTLLGSARGSQGGGFTSLQSPAYSVASGASTAATPSTTATATAASSIGAVTTPSAATQEAATAGETGGTGTGGGGGDGGRRDRATSWFEQGSESIGSAAAGSSATSSSSTSGGSILRRADSAPSDGGSGIEGGGAVVANPLLQRLSAGVTTLPLLATAGSPLKPQLRSPPPSGPRPPSSISVLLRSAARSLGVHGDWSDVGTRSAGATGTAAGGGSGCSTPVRGAAAALGCRVLLAGAGALFLAAACSVVSLAPDAAERVALTASDVDTLRPPGSPWTHVSVARPLTASELAQISAGLPVLTAPPEGSVGPRLPPGAPQLRTAGLLWLVAMLLSRPLLVLAALAAVDAHTRAVIGPLGPRWRLPGGPLATARRAVWLAARLALPSRSTPAVSSSPQPTDDRDTLFAAGGGLATLVGGLLAPELLALPALLTAAVCAAASLHGGVVAAPGYKKGVDSQPTLMPAAAAAAAAPAAVTSAAPTLSPDEHAALARKAAASYRRVHLATTLALDGVLACLCALICVPMRANGAVPTLLAAVAAVRAAAIAASWAPPSAAPLAHALVFPSTTAVPRALVAPAEARLLGRHRRAAHVVAGALGRRAYARLLLAYAAAHADELAGGGGDPSTSGDGKLAGGAAAGATAADDEEAAAASQQAAAERVRQQQARLLQQQQAVIQQQQQQLLLLQHQPPLLPPGETESAGNVVGGSEAAVAALGIARTPPHDGPSFTSHRDDDSAAAALPFDASTNASTAAGGSLGHVPSSPQQQPRQRVTEQSSPPHAAASSPASSSPVIPSNSSSSTERPSATALASSDIFSSSASSSSSSSISAHGNISRAERASRLAAAAPAAAPGSSTSSGSGSGSGDKVVPIAAAWSVTTRPTAVETVALDHSRVGGAPAPPPPPSQPTRPAPAAAPVARAPSTPTAAAAPPPLASDPNKVVAVAADWRVAPSTAAAAPATAAAAIAPASAAAPSEAAAAAAAAADPFKTVPIATGYVLVAAGRGNGAVAAPPAGTEGAAGGAVVVDDAATVTGDGAASPAASTGGGVGAAAPAAPRTEGH